ncbi:MAG: ATP synthase F1 subunit delta [Ekhidna sp.]|nr:ATP synthase F1 subunit delta [Ekhidna sp.]MBC6409241.1 ATP synthase F1 subunit delta [Ekhidna sp.]
MSDERVAARYAKPFLALAEEKKVLENVKKDMDSFLSICKENREFSLMLKSPIIPYFKKANILKKAFEGKYNDLTIQAFDLITRKNRENVLQSIADEFVHLYNIKKGITEVSVTTTFRLDAETKRSFEKLAKDITGKEPAISEVVDPEILGGYILKLGDKQIDDSVKGQLNNLKLKFF